jgi:hypothetical protein
LITIRLQELLSPSQKLIALDVEGTECRYEVKELPGRTNRELGSLKVELTNKAIKDRAPEFCVVGQPCQFNFSSSEQSSTRHDHEGRFSGNFCQILRVRLMECAKYASGEFFRLRPG